MQLTPQKINVIRDIHFYYRLTIEQFALYNFLISFLMIVISILQIECLITKNATKLTKVLWTFPLLVGLIIVAEIYLQARFIPKG